jgi:micrococcal nuclease
VEKERETAKGETTMRRLTTGILIFFLLILTGCYDAQNSIIAPEGYSVVRVVDGDTIIVDIDGTEERVRFIGVDTPESVHPDQSKNVEYGEIASEFTKSMLEDQSVTLEYDVQERDRYGRVLAYVYLDGEMFNKTLLEEGHAQVATYPPNVKYVEDFTAIQEKARDEEKGIWAYEAFEGSVGSEGSAASEEKNNEEKQTEEQASLGAEQPEDYYIGNSNTKKFHRPGCRYAVEIKPENSVTIEQRNDALQGYEPCKVCKP